MKRWNWLRGLLLILSISVLVSCAAVTEQDSAPTQVPVDISKIPDAIPKNEPRSRYGNPAQYAVFGKNYYTLTSADNYHEKGIASWYGKKFHGRRTSSGELYDMYAMTAAHKTLPLPSYVEVTNLENGRKVIVKVNDRGPFHDNRLIDLSYSAAMKLGIVAKGTGLVEVKTVTPASINQAAAQSTTAVAAIPVKSSGSALMFLQVGAFSTRVRAEQVKTRLQNDVAFAINIVPFNVASNTLYRVRVGPLASVTQGDSLVSELARLGFRDTQIVIE